MTDGGDNPPRPSLKGFPSADDVPHGHDYTPADTDTDTDDDYRVVGGDVSCRNCAHRPVCAIRSGFEGLATDERLGGDEPPIDPDDLAVICDEYVQVK